MFCESHFHEKIVAYNPTSDELLCAQCLSSTQYSSHKASYELIEDTFEKMKQVKSKQKKQCSTLMQDLNKKLFEIQKTKSDLKGEIEKTNMQINSFFTQVRESIDRQEKNMGEYMNQIFQNQETKLNSQEKINQQNIKFLQDIVVTIGKYDQNMYVSLLNQKKFQVQIEKIQSDINMELTLSYNIPDIDYSKIFSQILQDSSELFQRFNVPLSGNSSALTTTDNTSNLKETNFSMTNTFIITNTQNNLTRELKSLNEEVGNSLYEQYNSNQTPIIGSNNVLKETLKNMNQIPKTKVLHRTQSGGNILNSSNQTMNNSQIYYKSNNSEKQVDNQIQKNVQKGTLNNTNNNSMNTIFDEKENMKSIEQEKTPLLQINSNSSSLAQSHFYSSNKKQLTPSEKKQVNNYTGQQLKISDVSKFNSIVKIVGDSKLTPQYPKIKTILTEQTAKQQQLLNNQISKKISSISSATATTTAGASSIQNQNSHQNNTPNLFDKISSTYSQLYKHSMTNQHTSHQTHQLNNSSSGNYGNTSLSNNHSYNYNASSLTSRTHNDESAKKKSQRSISTVENNYMNSNQIDNSHPITNNSSTISNNESYTSKSRVSRMSYGSTYERKSSTPNLAKQIEEPEKQYIKVADQLKKLYSDQNSTPIPLVGNYAFVPHTQIKTRKHMSANSSPNNKKIASPTTSRLIQEKIAAQSARTSPKNPLKSPNRSSIINSGSATQRSPKNKSQVHFAKPPTHQSSTQNSQLKSNASPHQQQNLLNNNSSNNNSLLFTKTQGSQHQTKNIDFSQTSQLQHSKPLSQQQQQQQQGYSQRYNLAQQRSQSASNLHNQSRSNSSEGYRNQAYQFKNKFVDATKSSRSLSTESIKRTVKDSDLSDYSNMINQIANSSYKKPIQNNQNKGNILLNNTASNNNNISYQNKNNNYSFQYLNNNNSSRSYNNESLGALTQKQSQQIIQNLSKREFFEIKQDITIISKDSQYNYEMIFKNKSNKMDLYKPVNHQIKQIMNDIEGFNLVHIQDGSFYLFNGMIQTKLTKIPNNFIYRINFQNQIIEEKIEYSPSAPRYNGCAVRMKDQILICGGRDSKDVILDNVEILKIKRNQYHNLAITRMNKNRHQFALSKITNMIYIALGGRTGPKNTVTNTCESLTITSTQAIWNQFPSMLVSRYAFQSAFVNNKLFAIGGINEQGNVLNSIEFCDLETYLSSSNTHLLGDSHQITLPIWKFVDCKMQIPRHSFGISLQNNEIIIIGGISSSSNVYDQTNSKVIKSTFESENSVEVFDSDSQQTFYIMNTLFQRSDLHAFPN